MSLFDELKRRNVIKVAGAYLALGWIVIQVTETLTPVFHLPESALPLVTWIGVIGFPFAVLFSWVYELTPEGLKRESEIDRSQSITQLTSKRLDHVIIGMLALAMLLFVADRFLPRDAVGVGAAPDATGREADASPVGADHGRDTSLAAAPTSDRAQGALPQEPISPATVAPSEKSIAVLPFVNMSEDASNAFFADGISEELLNLLAKIPELQVIARTSSFAFKDQQGIEIPEIARRLNVAHVLEGSVRRSGNRVRITAQLIRAGDGVHLWSETYDRTLDDIFAVQDEIAGAVVTQLKITLLGTAPKARQVDPKAYALYLQGRQLDRQGTVASYEQAIALYKQALAIDARYAEAWSGLAATYSHQSDNAIRPFAEGYPLAREAASAALAIDAGYAPAHANLGSLAMNFDGDLSASARHFARSLELEPANPDIIGDAAFLARALGRVDTAIALEEYALSRDPLNPGSHVRLGTNYIIAGRLDDALGTLRTAAELSPGFSGVHYRIGQALLLKGEPVPALEAIARESFAGWRMVGLPLAYHALRQPRESDTALAELITRYERDFAYNIAYVMAYRGEADRAFEWLDKAVDYRDPGLADVAVEPLFSNIHADPRWLAFLRARGRAPEQLAAIPFMVKVPQ